MRAATTRLLCLLAAAALAAPAAAADDAFEFYKEEAQFTTASRRAEPAWRAPAAVDVVTAEDIRAYGFRNIWDALRFRAGMDVVEGRSIDGQRALVSARGFNTEFVTEMQVLVDGRSIYSPLLGGVYWGSIPVQMQNIERIEIVRGPNAALYGSNAGLGVVNIITKKPGVGRQASVRAAGGNRELGSAEAAEAGGDAAGLRVSHSFRQDEGHPNASGPGDGNDFIHSNNLDLRGRWDPDARTDVDLIWGSAWTTAGLPALAADPQSRHRDWFESARVSRRLGGDSSVEAAFSHTNTRIALDPLAFGAVRIRSYQYDAEALHRFSWADERVRTTWGGNWRESGVYSDQAFAGRPAQTNRLVRGYMHHSARLADPLTLVAGLSLEHTDTGGTEPAWQAAALLSPVPEHAFRLSYSVAPTIPSLFAKAGDYRLSPVEHIVGNPGIAPERLASWEAGWSARLLDGALKPAADVYYMTLRNQHSGALQPSGVVMLTADNSAIARGAETSVEWAPRPGAAVFANYTYQVLTTTSHDDVFLEDASQNSPRHKFNLGGRASLPRGFTAAAALGYKDDYTASSTSRGTTIHVPSFWRLDARVGWSPAPGWELFVAAQSLLRPSQVEYADGIATPRTYQAGVSGRFAP